MCFFTNMCIVFVTKLNICYSSLLLLVVAMGWGKNSAGVDINTGRIGVGLTLTKCLSVCSDKRKADSSLNGVMFDPSDGDCWCMIRWVTYRKSSWILYNLG